MTGMPRLLTPPPPYCDGRDGHRVELVPDAKLMHDGRDVPLPDGINVLFVRMHPGGLRFAGQGGSGALDLHAMEWDGTQWINHGPAPGQRSVIYDAQGVLQIAPLGPTTVTGSQGWRYVDDAGQLVSSDATMADVARHIWEYTVRGDVTIGQGGDEEGLQALVAGRRVLLSDGIWRFVNVYRTGDFIEIAGVRNNVADFLKFTRAELDAMPTYTVPSVEPPVDPPPPQPEPAMPLIAPNMIATVQRALREHPEINPRDEDQRGQIIDYACSYTGDPRWGRKARNADGSNKNTDGMAYNRPDGLFEIYDALSGTTGAATWDGSGPFRPGENGFWAPAEPVGDTPAPPDGPPATDPSDDVLAAKVNELERRVQALEARPSGGLSGRIALRTDNGHYICAENSGGGEVNATRTAAAAWETFTVEQK